MQKIPMLIILRAINQHHSTPVALVWVSSAVDVIKQV